MNLKIIIPATTLMLISILTGCGTQNSTSSISGNNANEKSATQWISANPSGKTANLRLEAAYKNINGGFNFNGFSSGNMTVTIPKGWDVQVSFTNDSSDDAHSAMIVPYNDRQATNLSASSEAFKNSSTPNSFIGVMKGTKQKFNFIASKAGKYAIVCGVPGHDAAGMWDTLIVSDSASTATISTQQ